LFLEKGLAKLFHLGLTFFHLTKNCSLLKQVLFELGSFNVNVIVSKFRIIVIVASFCKYFFGNKFVLIVTSVFLYYRHKETQITYS
jgi:hypothetical protein